MSSASSGNTNSHYNPDEPRDERGRWTTGGSSWRVNPLRNPSPAGCAHTLLGHALASAWHQGLIREFKLPTQDEADRFARTLAAWNAAADFDPTTFRERFTRGLVDHPATIARLRQAAAGAAEAQTFGQMVDASRPLTAAIKDIGADRWTWVRDDLAERAKGAMPVQFAAPVGTTSGKARTEQTGLAAGDPPQGRGPKAALPGAGAGFLPPSAELPAASEAASALARLGLGAALLSPAMFAAFLGALLVVIWPSSIGEESVGTLPDGTRYRLRTGTTGTSLELTGPDGKPIKIPTAPDGEVRDSKGRLIGRVRDGILVIAQTALRDLAGLDQRGGNACPPAVDDRRGYRSRISLLYEAYIHQLINYPPTETGKGVALPTPLADLIRNLRRDRRVMFDDCQRETGIMVEAKGLGYTKLLTDSEESEERTLDQWQDQAKRQDSAARGRPIIWFFAEKAAADAARTLFEKNDFNITVVYMPMPGAKR